MRGRFTPGVQEDEWCERRLLARIHRYTVKRLRAEIEPVQARDFLRFLFEWQRVMPEARMQGPDAVAAVLDAARRLRSAGRARGRRRSCRRASPNTSRRGSMSIAWPAVSSGVAWRRARQTRSAERAPVRSTPITLLARRNVKLWSAFAEAPDPAQLTATARDVAEFIQANGASFFDEIVEGVHLLPTQAEEALAELVALGVVNSDSFGGLRALLVPSERRSSTRSGRRRRRRAVRHGRCRALGARAPARRHQWQSDRD